MSTTCAAVVLLGILITDPASGFASTRSSDSQSATTQVARAVVAMYATRGVVKSVDATSLVITRSAMKRNDMVFVLNPATQREGGCRDWLHGGSAVSHREETAGGHGHQGSRTPLMRGRGQASSRN